MVKSAGEDAGVLPAKGQDVLLSAVKTGGRIGTTAEKTKQADADSHENSGE